MTSVFLDLWALIASLMMLLQARSVHIFSQETPRLRDVDPVLRGAWPLVSVIVPACDEESTIVTALRSLLAVDYPALEIILVNDRSRDRTGALMESLSAADPRVRVRHISSLPEGWLGKPHALHLGSQEARGDFLLFTDADVMFEATTLRRAIAAMESQQLDMATVLPEFIAHSWSLRLAQAYFFQSAAVSMSPRKVRDPHHPQAVGVGAFNLVRTSAFRRTPGFEWLRGEVIEDIATGYMMKKHGGNISFWNGIDQLSIEWYPSLGGLVRGFEKNNFSVMEYSLKVLGVYLAVIYSLWAGVTIVPFFGSSWVAPIVALAWLCYLVAAARVLSTQRYAPWLAMFFPIVIPLFPLIMVRSAFLCLKRGGIVWRGTFYGLAFLRAHQRFSLRDFYKRS